MMNHICELLNETLVAEITLKNNVTKNNIEQQGVILFGSGNLGRKIASYFKSKNYKIECFVDNNDEKNNTIIDNIVVYSPKTAFEKFGTRNFTWVITIWSPGHSFKKTYEQLNQLGVQNIVPVNNIFQIFFKRLTSILSFSST